MNYNLLDLESDLGFIILLEAVFPTGDGVGPHTVSHREAVSCPHQDGVVRGTREQGHPADMTATVLQGAQPGVLVIKNLRSSNNFSGAPLDSAVREVFQQN